ncbi:MAG: rod-binding protein [Pseudomonadota bacterium]
MDTLNALSALGPGNAVLDLQTKRAQASALAVGGGAGQDAGSQDQLRAMAEEFEQIFLQSMLSTMMQGTTPAAPFNGGAGETQWQGFLTNEYAGALSKGGGVGLADAIYADLIQLQEGASQTANAASNTQASTLRIGDKL